MNWTCEDCGAWAPMTVDLEGGALVCGECAHREPRRFLPLFVVTGASGTGKTTVVKALRGLLPHWDIFETDILWDSGGSWETAKCNWLRIAHSVAQSGRATILCGTILPDQLAGCDHLACFPRVHYLNLHCDDAVREGRLRGRPPWRGCDDAFVAEHAALARWLLEHAETAFDPPLVTVDASHLAPAEAAERIRHWALDCWGGPAGDSADTSL